MDGIERASSVLPAPGRPGHDDIVPARRGHLQRALDVLLALDELKVAGVVRLVGIGVHGEGGGVGRDRLKAPKVVDELGQDWRRE